ncbi:MAG: hypothetical protein ACAI35_19945 [Candidatus Methylacidiphilales bacterium]|nr:hypothetical protein [Candidatus Methylacidiphilales bacterium]
MINKSLYILRSLYHFSLMWFVAVALLIVACVPQGTNAAPPPAPPPVPSGSGSQNTLNQFNATRGRNNINLDDRLRAQTRKKLTPQTSYGKRPASAGGKYHFSSYDFLGENGSVAQPRNR